MASINKYDANNNPQNTDLISTILSIYGNGENSPEVQRLIQDQLRQQGLDPNGADWDKWVIPDQAKRMQDSVPGYTMPEQTHNVVDNYRAPTNASSAPASTAPGKKTIANITQKSFGSTAPATYGQKNYTGDTVIYSDGTTEKYDDFFAREIGNQNRGGSDFRSYIGKSYGGPTASNASSSASTPTGTSTASPAGAQSTSPATATAGRAFTAEDDLRIMKELGLSVQTAGQGEVGDALLRNQDLIPEYERLRKAIESSYSWGGDSRRNVKLVPATSAYEKAKQDAQRYVTDRGLDYSQYGGDIDRELERIYKSVPYGPSVDASSYFDPNTASNVLNKTESAKRTGYLNQFNALLPEDYSKQAFADTSDDEIIDKILGEQYGKATSLVDMNKKRGTLTDSGYSSALNTLAQQKQQASSKLQNIGGNVLTGYRGQIDDIIGEGRTKAGSYTLGQTYDPTSYKTQAETKRTDLSGRLEGDIRGSAGADSLFDTSSALGSGYQAQGAQNTSRQGILDALANKERSRQTQRGVGSQGAF